MPFEPHEPHVMLVEFDMDSLLLFPTSQEGYQTARFWNCWACDQPVSLILEVKVTPGARSYLSAVLFSKVISYNIMLCLISICLLILHLSAAICEIWPLNFTYSVYLVLSIKLGVTVVPTLVMPHSYKFINLKTFWLIII
jgi:hypothetical protein